VKCIKYQPRDENEKDLKMLKIKEERRVAKILLKINLLIVESNLNIVKFKEQMRVISETINPKMVNNAKNVGERINGCILSGTRKEKIDASNLKIR
jgi:hypothetical protein